MRKLKERDRRKQTLDAAAAPSGTIGSTDAQASVLPVTLDPQIAVAPC